MTAVDADPAGGAVATDLEEEGEIANLNEWVVAQGLPRGLVGCELVDETTGVQRALLDLAWPDGLQHGLSAPVAVLLNEPPEVLSIASASGYRCFTSSDAFRVHVEAEILGTDAPFAASHPPPDAVARA